MCLYFKNTPLYISLVRSFVREVSKIWRLILTKEQDDQHQPFRPCKGQHAK